MARTLQLVHLTDMHLCREQSARVHRWHVQQAFDSVLTHALRRYPDFAALVLGGDLVDDESERGYRRLGRRLGELARPVLAMAGNHDDPAALARCLDSAHVHATLALGDWQLHALNTHIDHSQAGRIGDAQLAELARRLDAAPADSLVCAHHPPVALGSAWLDAIGLADADALARLLARYPRVRGVLCGHAHQRLDARLGAIPCWTSPATMRQFLPASPAFAEDQARAPGYRWLELGPGGAIRTRVHRVAAARAARGRS